MQTCQEDTILRLRKTCSSEKCSEHGIKLVYYFCIIIADTFSLLQATDLLKSSGDRVNNEKIVPSTFWNCEINPELNCVVIELLACE